MKPFDEGKPLRQGKATPVQLLNRCVAKPGFSGVLHYHDYSEWLVCKTGALRLITLEEERPLSPGDLVLIGSGIPHGLRYETPYSEHGCVKFSNALITQNGGELPGVCGVFPLLSGEHRPVLLGAAGLREKGYDPIAGFARAWEGCSRQTPGWELTVLSLLFSWLAAAAADWAMAPVSEKDREFLLLNQEYLQKNLAVATLASAAGENGMEYCYFSRVFHERFGMPFREYLQQRRLLTARQLLLETRDSVTEIAGRVGFSSVSYFIETFRRQTGKTPLSFRREIHKSR